MYRSVHITKVLQTLAARTAEHHLQNFEGDALWYRQLVKSVTQCRCDVLVALDASDQPHGSMQNWLLGWCWQQHRREEDCSSQHGLQCTSMYEGVRKKWCVLVHFYGYLRYCENLTYTAKQMWHQMSVFLLSRWPAAWLSVSVLCFWPAADLIYGSRWAAYSAPFVADWVDEKKMAAAIRHLPCKYIRCSKGSMHILTSIF